MNLYTIFKVLLSLKILVLVGSLLILELKPLSEKALESWTVFDTNPALKQSSPIKSFSYYALRETDYNKTLFEARLKVKEGLTAYKNKKYQEAIQWFTEALELNSSSIEAYEKRALSWARLGYFEKAKIDFSHAIELEPRNGKLYSYRGSIYMEEQFFLKAISDYNKWITLNPQDPQPYFYRGTAYLRISEGKRAIADFTDVLFHQPSNEQAYYNRGVMHALLGQYDEAIIDFTRAVQLNKYLSEGYLSRALAKSQLNRHADALIDIEKALEITPLYVEAYIAQGNSFQALGKLDQAHMSLTKATEIDPLSSEAYYALATLETLRQQSTLATAHYKNTLRILDNEIRNNLSHPRYYSDRGRVQRILKNPTAALKDYKKAYALYQTLGDRVHTTYTQKKIKELEEILKNDSSNNSPIDNKKLK